MECPRAAPSWSGHPEAQAGQLDTSSQPLVHPHACGCGVLVDLCLISSLYPACLVSLSEGGSRVPPTIGVSQDILSTYYVMGQESWEASHVHAGEERGLPQYAQEGGSGQRPTCMTEQRGILEAPKDQASDRSLGHSDTPTSFSQELLAPSTGEAPRGSNSVVCREGIPHRNQPTASATLTSRWPNLMLFVETKSSS